MMREFKFLISLWKANLLSAMEFRVAFITQILGMILNNGFYFLFWVIFFDRFQEVRGWVINDMLLVNLPSEDSDSIGGFIVNYLGRVPQTNESFSYDYTPTPNTNGNGIPHKELHFSIIDSDERRISLIKLKLVEPVPKP